MYLFERSGSFSTLFLLCCLLQVAHFLDSELAHGLDELCLIEFFVAIEIILSDKAPELSLEPFGLLDSLERVLIAC